MFILAIFLVCPISGDDEISLKARATLFDMFDSYELIKLRRVCKKWRNEINMIFRNDTNHLALFNSRYNFNEYLHFLQVTGYKNDSAFQLKTYNSPKSIVLFVNNTQTFFESCFLNNFNQVKKVTYFGCSPTESWHLYMNSILGKILKVSPVESIVLHRYGYFTMSNVIQNNSALFSKLKSIHLVQPSKTETQVWTNRQFNDQNFVFAGGHFPSPITKDLIYKTSLNFDSTPKTKVFVHQLVPYFNNLLFDKETGYAVPEPYFDIFASLFK